ncbi:MAG: Nif3-like dinuclear metal center hexameric protein [Candidatus Micrarchaeia archaeon]
MPRSVALSRISSFLGKTFNVAGIQDDSCNGLQNSGLESVSKVATAVDASLQTFQAARAKGAQFLIVHHGLFWKYNLPKTLSPLWKKRLSFLSREGLSLYALHLPLDLHPVYGNNALLCDALGIGNRKGFGEYHDLHIGFSGSLPRVFSQKEFAQLLSQKIAKPQTLLFGSKKIRKIGLVSGGGAFAIEEAAEKGLDALVVGEFKHSHYHLAKECAMNVFACGHYETETYGVKAVGKLVEKKFSIPSVFVGAPTGL